MADEPDPGFVDVDLAIALGADFGLSMQCFTIYIPNKDQHGQEIGNQRKWILEASRILSEINGGATAMPPVEGGWLNDNGEIIWEHPVVVYSFLNSEKFVDNLARVREFLHRMGRETNQGEIAFEVGEVFYRIRTFDSSPRVLP